MADNLNISGGRELDEALRTLAVKVERNILRSALRQGANAYKDEVKQNIPVDSGDLRRSVRVSTRSKGGTVYASVKIGNKKAWYAHLVEFGTRAHKIKPKNAQALAFGGAIVREVDHPGSRAKPFARPAFYSKSAAAIAAVAAQIRKRLTAEGINVPAPEGE